MTRLCFIDTETTGLDPDRHEVYEIGLIVRDDGHPDHEYRWWLRVDLDRADPNALRVGRYFDRHPDLHNLRLIRQWWPDSDSGLLVESGSSLSPQSVSIKDSAERLMWLTAGAHLVGAVPSFDAAFLSRLLRANGCCPAWHYHLVDVEALAAGYLAGRSDSVAHDMLGALAEEGMDLCRPPWNSGDLSRAVGVEPKDYDRHTALGDARWAKAIYDVVMGGERP